MSGQQAQTLAQWPLSRALKAVGFALLLGLLAACSSTPLATQAEASGGTNSRISGGSNAANASSKDANTSNSAAQASVATGPAQPPLAPVSVPTPPVVLSPPVAPKPLRIGLALGGGAARGFAHIGVIKALEANGIVPDVIVGTSAGSVVAALYATGVNGLELHRMALQMDESSLADWALPFVGRFGGFLKGEGIENYVNKMVNNRSIEKLPRALGVVATDLQTGRGVLFQRGNTGIAVRASSSIPGVFKPVTVGNKDYVDGGLVAPVPVRYARQMGADFVIAVNISEDPSEQDPSGALGVLWHTTSIMGQSINHFELALADVVLKPALPTMKGNDFSSRNSAVLAGEQVVSTQWAHLRDKLQKARLNH
jgi:NTE family protein